MHTRRYALLSIFLIGCILTAGCMVPYAGDNQTVGAPVNSIQPVVKSGPSLAQPEESAKMIRMGSDVYNPGDVVEFVVINEKRSDLICSDTPPSFSVRYQKGTGQWVTRMGEENPAAGNSSRLKPGDSTTPYRFVTTGWSPGRYRIVSDCGVSREILLREPPPVTPDVTPCPAATNVSPYLRVNPISDQYAGKTFTISGTTSLGVGDEIRYSIFAMVPAATSTSAAKLVSSSTKVSGGICGINTWSVSGVIEVPGDYIIGISDRANTVTATRRFSVLAVSPAGTATLPVKTKAPGISTG